jgi:intein/homing endonuclease
MTKKDGDQSKLLDKNILEFVTAPWGLALGCGEVPALYPAQRFILKCVSGDSTIIGDDGIPCTVRDFHANNHKTVTTFDGVDWKIKRVPHEGVWKSGTKKVYRLTTKLSKRWIEVSADHLVMAASGYRRLDELKKGDVVVVTSREPFLETDSGVLEWEAGLLGLMIGDGECAHSGIGLVVANGQELIRDYFEDCVQRLDRNMVFRTRVGSGCTTVYASRTNGWDRNTKSALGKFLADHGVMGKTCHYKRVPLKIFQARKEVQAEFLRCLFSTDGGLSTLHGRTLGVCIVYTSCNRDLIDDVRVLVSRFGIRSTVEYLSSETNFGVQSVWQIKITSVSEIRSFFEGVGVPIGWESRYKEAWNVIRTRKSYCHMDSLPCELINVAKEVRRRFKDKGGKIPRGAPAKVRAQTTGKDMMKELADWTGDEEAARIANSDVCWDKVASIEFVGEKDVYDIAVPRTHNFVIGGMIVHNCYYGLELDNSDNRDIIVKDKFCEQVLYRFNEYEYMRYLYNEGRINKIVDHPFSKVVMVCGRRSGKTTVTACIIGYEAYRLLNKFCPQEYYGIMPEDEITFTCVATNRETAGILFSKVAGHIERSEFFRKFRVKPTSQRIALYTQRDLDRYGKHGRPSISVRVAACSAKGLRGQGNMIAALDEMAFFFMDETTGQKKTGGSEGDHDDKAVYKAVTPSVAKFKTPGTGTPEGKIICISSPGPKSGMFYQEYERGFEDGNDDLLVIQAPTWEIDPNISSQFLRQEYKRNSITFKSEYGAQFSDRLFGWIEDPQIVRQCVVPELKYKQSSMQRIPHFMGVDIGMKKDGTAIAVCHWVKEIVGGAPIDRIEVDAVDVRYLDYGNEEENEQEIEEQILDTAENPRGRIKLPYFDPQELADWFEEFTKRFLVVKGLMDQYYGYSVQPLLIKKGLKQFELREFHESLNSYVYQNLLTLFVGAEVRLPEGDPVEVNGRIEKDSALVREILTLQAESRSKYIVRVHHPERDGMHNDMSDALSRACLLAVEYRNKGFGNLTSSTGGSSAHAAMGAIRASRHSEMVKASLGRPSGGHILRTRSRAGMGRFAMRPTLYR